MQGDFPRRAGQAASGPWMDSRGRRWLRRVLAARPRASRLAAGMPLLVLSGPAAAQTPGLAPISTVDIIQLAVFVGIIGAALISAIFLIRERARISAENAELRTKLADLNAIVQRSESLLNLRDQRVVAWPGDRSKPDLVGGLPEEAGAPEDRAAFLAFGRWLSPRSAAALDKAIAALRERGVPFDLAIGTQSGAALDVQGRKTAAHVIVRFMSLSENHRMQARLRLENQRLAADYDTMLGLIDALRMPFWLRSADGRLKWVNRAYAEAVDGPNADDVVREGREFLGTLARESVAAHHAKSQVFEQAVSTVVAGDRRVFAVTDFAGSEGSAGIASDTSAAETIRSEYERTVRSHADMLDQLTTAVASFDSNRKLRFYNQAFQKLWALEPAFLDSAPDHALLLDRLRSDGKLAEQPEWRRWKENILDAYRSVDPQEHWWHLPDARTIRVVANPQPTGGATWVFENLTEKMNLESRYNTALRVQGETLDNLAEGVAVFGSDGRIRLANPAFVNLWKLPTDLVARKMHISAIAERCGFLADPSPWPSFAASVTGFDDERRDGKGQVELRGGMVLRHALIHLPNGQAMITFVDVTDSVKVERALTDRNEALLRADQMKNDFVQHVSYELRSPLTNIIGFTELLALPGTGPLLPRQREYLEHIGSSSAVLLTIVNDILDLATVDAGIMELDIAEVRIDQTVAAAAELVSDRFEEHSIRLSTDLSAAPPSIEGDAIRVRQILYNLLSNAVNYAPEGSTVRLSCRAVDAGAEFSVHDDGPGMSPEILDTVFRRFEPQANGGRRRGAGLGLSIVKSFVELHGGTVRIDTGPSIGTTVVCTFPLAPKRSRAAAE